MTKPIPPFEVYAHLTHQEDGSRKPTWASISWADHDGNRYHTAVVRGENGKWVLRHHRRMGQSTAEAYIVKSAPLMPDGKTRSRYDEGYFPSRYLDPYAKAHKHIVEAALAWANGPEDPIAVNGQQQIEDEIAKENAAQAEYAQRLRKALRDFCEGLQSENINLWHNVMGALGHATDEQVRRLASAIHRA